MSTTCKWYVSVIQTECGEPAEGKPLTHLPGGKKLNKPLPVCTKHRAHVDRIFAAMRVEGRRGKTA